MVSDLTMKNGRLYSNELRKLAKAMNQRMVELEKRGFKSPAYQSVQARLEALGRTAKTAPGRRFSESGYFANKNEAAQVEAILKRFKTQQTSTLKGYRRYRADVLEGLQKRYEYKQYGMTDEEMMEFWEAMPDDERDRMYGSDETFMIVSKFLIDKKQRKAEADKMTKAEKRKKLKGMSPEEKEEQAYIQRLDTYTMQEIVDIIQRQKSLTDALDALGIDTREYMDFKSGKIKGMGAL
jgi:hypothetical protein